MRWEAQTVRTEHPAGHGNCFLLPDDCPHDGVYYTDDVVWVAVPI